MVKRAWLHASVGSRDAQSHACPTGGADPNANVRKSCGQLHPPFYINEIARDWCFPNDGPLCLAEARFISSLSSAPMGKKAKWAGWFHSAEHVSRHGSALY